MKLMSQGLLLLSSLRSAHPVRAIGGIANEYPAKKDA